MAKVFGLLVFTILFSVPTVAVHSQPHKKEVKEITEKRGCLKPPHKSKNRRDATMKTRVVPLCGDFRSLTPEPAIRRVTREIFSCPVEQVRNQLDCAELREEEAPTSQNTSTPVHNAFSTSLRILVLKAALLSSKKSTP